MNHELHQKAQEKHQKLCKTIEKMKSKDAKKYGWFIPIYERVAHWVNFMEIELWNTTEKSEEKGWGIREYPSFDKPVLGCNEEYWFLMGVLKDASMRISMLWTDSMSEEEYIRHCRTNGSTQNPECYFLDSVMEVMAELRREIIEWRMFEEMKTSA